MDKIKVNLGRKLTREEMEGAEFKEAGEPLPFMYSSKGPIEIDHLRRLPSGEYVRFRENSKRMRTQDVSHGWNIPHVGYYPMEARMGFYNQEGLLTEEKIKTWNWFDGRATTNIIKKEYEPAGRIIGKKLKDEGSGEGQGIF